MAEMCLHPVSGGRAMEDAAQGILVTHFPFVLGRSRACNHVLCHPMVSRQHCRLSVDGDSVLVEDLRTRNGTSVNARPVTSPRRVQDGDLLKIGPLFFQVRLGAPALAEGTVAAGGTAPGGRPRQVLVVEDNADTAEILAILLHDRGHEVRIARDGRQALQAVRERPPDAILLDIRLPGMDGYQVAERLRRHAPLQKARLVALTGYESEVDRRRSREAGFDLLLTKPVDLETLQQALCQPG